MRKRHRSKRHGSGSHGSKRCPTAQRGGTPGRRTARPRTTPPSSAPTSAPDALPASRARTRCAEKAPKPAPRHPEARNARSPDPHPSWLAATWLWLVGCPVPQSQPSRSFPTLGLLSALVCTWSVALLTLGPSLGAVGCSEPKEGPPPIEEGTIRGLSDADTLLFYDQRGTLLTETSGTGKVRARFNAYPYGATRHQSSSETRLYANAPRDTGVGLDHMGARFYAPDLGTWTIPDPVLVNAPEAVATAEFATANPYVYANLNPVIAVDDDGNFWHIALGAGIGAVFGGGVEAARQYAVHSSIQDWGRIGAAAAGGAVSGTVLAAAPQVGLGSFLLTNAGSTAAAGVTERLIVSGGADAGTLQDVAIDAGVGAVTAGLLKGGAAALRKAKPTRPMTTGGGSASGDETVSVFHGSIRNGHEVLGRGLDPARAPSFVSRDMAAARDALLRHPDAVPGMGTIIESRIPVSRFQAVLAPLERPYSGFYPYTLQSTEITLRTGDQIKLFNQFIVKLP